MALEALSGSEAAYRELMRRFERPVFALVRRMVRDPALAEDLTQEAFVRAFQKLSSYDPQRKFSSWLFKIAHNRTIDSLRRKKLATVPLEAESGEMGPIHRLAGPRSANSELGLERHELAAAIEAAMADLRPEYRDAVWLRFGEHLSYDEIAQILEIPLGTLKTRLHRARKRMAESLTEAGWGRDR